MLTQKFNLVKNYKQTKNGFNSIRCKNNSRHILCTNFTVCISKKDTLHHNRVSFSCNLESNMDRNKQVIVGHYACIEEESPDKDATQSF